MQTLFEFCSLHELPVASRSVAAELCYMMVCDAALLQTRFQILTLEVVVFGRWKSSHINNHIYLVYVKHTQKLLYTPVTGSDSPYDQSF
jgi:hypothetical protein